MANCHNLFQDFHQEIRLLSSKRNAMQKSKDSLRERITNHFKEHNPEYVPKYYIQGSYKMKNGIRYKDDTADLDDGIYFEREPDVTGTTLQKWVYEAVEGHTEGGQQHKKKCIRVIYANDYNIDLPVLYKVEDEDHPRLAVKNEDWAKDDPKALVEWFKEQQDDDGQLIRIIKYLKAWGDHKRHNMPNGLCKTILAEANIEYHERDDESLKCTLANIKDTLDTKWECFMPTYPEDDLFEEYDDTFQKNFMESLKTFVDDAEEALKADDEEKASKLWRKHLGERFPVAEKDKSKSNIKNVAALGSIAGVNKPWAR